MERHFIGAASLDLLERNGGVELRGRFHGVESRVPFTPPELAGRMHLRAEAGTFQPPFPSRTGWCGLCRRLENRCGGAGCWGVFSPGTDSARPNKR